MRLLSSLLDKLHLKPFVIAGLDVAKISTGAVTFALKGSTPAFAYQAMVQLYCLTSGYSNDLFSKIINLIRPHYQLRHRDGVLGHMDDSRLEIVMNDLKTSGYHVFSQKLSAELCDRLQEIALTTKCSVRAMDSEAAPKEKVLYDRNNVLGIRYEFSAQDLINHPDVQNLMADVSLLAVAQEYLGSAPVLDIVGLWWHTAFSKKPDKLAAQYYHFDMDRVKWLKFFFYLTDVSPDSGPHCFVAGSHRSGRMPKELLKHGYARLTDADVQRHFHDGELIEFTGARGTIIAEDTRGLHKGKHVHHGERLMFEIEFANSLFGGELPNDHLTRPASERLEAAIEQYPAVYELFTAPREQKS